MKINFALIPILLFTACSNKPSPQPLASDDDYDFDGITLSRAKVKDNWLTALSEKNPQLYVEVAKALITSRNMNRPVYILKENTNGMTFYYVSLESGGGRDTVVADYTSKEIRFDHYNDSDGPALMDSAQRLWIEKKVQMINKEIRAEDYK